MLGLGMARDGVPRTGEARVGEDRQAMAWLTVGWQGGARHGVTGVAKPRQEKAVVGAVREGLARRGRTRMQT
jgi:hypothetical protein